MDAVSEQSFWAKLKGEFSLKYLVPSFVGGTILALFEVVLAVSFAALIFPGVLSPFTASGIGLALVGAIVTAVATSLLTTLPGTVSGNQDAPAAILAVISTAIAGRVTAGAETIFVTVVTAVALTTLFTGLFYLALGTFKAGRWVRFLPYPVIGGFLGGTGWLLAIGALGLLTDLPITWAGLPALLPGAVLLRWLPGLLFALALFWGNRKVAHFLFVPGMVLGGVLLFYVAVWLLGFSVAEITADGWLLGPFPNQSLWTPLTNLDFSLVDWQAIGSQAGSILTILIVSTISLLLNAGGLELSTAKDVDLNRELQAAGLGNVLASFGGGFVGYQQLSLSILNFKLGAGTRLTGLISAVLCAIVLFQGAAVLAFVPKLVVGGLLLYLGIDFLVDWVIESWVKLPKADALIIVLIVVVIATIGFLQGVLVGLVAAVVLFGVNYGRTDVVWNQRSGQYVRSRVTREPNERRRLKDVREQVHVWQLQGFLFFGTADLLYRRIRERMADANLPQLQFMVLDFHRVTGLDSTAVLSFQKLQMLAQKQSGILLFTGVKPQFQQQLATALAADDSVRWFASLDEGMEWCENRLLAANPDAADEPIPPGLAEMLAQILPGMAHTALLMSYFERRQIASGDVLIRQGDAPDVLLFVESGQVTAQLERPSQEPVRLETMGSGRVVGEIGFYLGQVRTASVVADKPGVVYQLTRQKLAQMEANAPEVASELHRLIAHLLAERATHLVETVDALLR